MQQRSPRGLLFTRPRADGQFLCARWGRPIVPVVFGVEDATLQTVKGRGDGGTTKVVALANHKMAETDGSHLNWART